MFLIETQSEDDDVVDCAIALIRGTFTSETSAALLPIWFDPLQEGHATREMNFGYEAAQQLDIQGATITIYAEASCFALMGAILFFRDHGYTVCLAIGPDDQGQGRFIGHVPAPPQ